MIVIFDNSALARLDDENECRRALDALKSVGPVRLTGTNFVEGVQIPAAPQRNRRLVVLSTLYSGIDPLPMPNELLGQACNAHAEGKLDSFDPVEPDYLRALEPGAVNDEISVETLNWHASRESDFTEQFRDMRPVMQAAINGRGGEPVRAGSLLKNFIQSNPAESLMIDVYERHTGTRLSPSELTSFLHHCPSFALFFAVRVYAQYHRAVKTTGFGPKKKAGVHDLDSATYLPFADLFVTNDNDQRRAFRLGNVLNPRRTRILSLRALLDAPPAIHAAASSA